MLSRLKSTLGFTAASLIDSIWKEEERLCHIVAPNFITHCVAYCFSLGKEQQKIVQEVYLHLTL